jgi:hypothetical protein
MNEKNGEQEGARVAALGELGERPLRARVGWREPGAFASRRLWT